MTAFTAEQAAAIDRRTGAFALAAAAGSGKTSVLVERYVRAVVEDGVAPSRILAITFTERAAGELRERVRRRLVDDGRREAARESAAAFVSTFHGFCARLLRGHAVLAGLPAAFSLLGDAQALTLREAAFDETLADWLDDPAALALAASFGVDELRAAVGSVYDELRSRGQRTPTLPPPRPRHDAVAAGARLAAASATLAAELGPDAPVLLGDCAALAAADALPEPLRVRELALGGRLAANASAADAYERARAEFEEACADAIGAPAIELLGALLRAFGERYEQRKRERGALDFDDLELEAGALLAAHDELRAQWSQRFELIMVDELQDTNARQLALLAALDRENLFTVGDELQAIYGFRHADVGLFRARFDELDAAGCASALSANFRARPALLDAVNAVFAQRFGARFRPLVAGRAAEAATDEPIVELLIADSDGWEGHEELLGVELAPAPLWRRAEARLLARRIDELIRAGTAAEDIAILFRAGGAVRVYETALADLGHATLTAAGGGFYERPEVLDLVCYVRALANPLDELALFGVLASPLCGLDADALATLALRAKEQGRAPWTTLEADPGGRRAADFVARFAPARARAVTLPLADVIGAAVAEHGYDVHLAGLHGPERRLANVHKLEQLARDFEEREGRDLRRFAQALAAGRVGASRETEAPPPAAGTGAVRLMTIHAAKGLEFPVVCLADLAHAASRSDPQLLVDGARVGLRLPSASRERIDTLDYAALRDERRREAAHEEERIIYVAMTRARERLILSGAARFASWPRDAGAPISWLAPALVGDIAARAGADRSGPEVVAGAGGVSVRLELCGAERAAELLAPPPLATRDVGFDQLVLPYALAADAAKRAAAAPEQPALSYTAIAEYERCGYRYRLQRQLGLPDVDPPGGGDGGDGGGAAAARGVALHALMESIDFATPVVEAAAAAAALAREGLREDPAALAALASAFARSPLCARLAAAEPVHREQPFAFLADGLLVRGVLDAAATEADGTLLIVDYKSDRVGEDEELAERVERDYALQRIVYALAGLIGGAPAVEVAHCFLHRPEAVLAVRFRAAARPALEAALAARVAPLRAGVFTVSADPGRVRCGTCPARARLCSWEERMTLREQAVSELEGER